MPDDAALVAERLSPRHRECLELVFARLTSKEIAVELGIGVGTVDSYISEAVALLGAKNRRRAAEMLFAAAPLSDPGSLQPQSAGVAAPAVLPPPPETDMQPGTVPTLLPFRSSGAKHNEFRPYRRVFWSLQIAFALAISFGALVSGLEVLSRLL